MWLRMPQGRCRGAVHRGDDWVPAAPAGDGTEQPEALRLYHSAGWRQIPCSGYFKDDPSTICMEKTVSGCTGEASRTGLDQDAPGSEGW